MKRILVLLLALFMAGALNSCKANQDSGTGTETATGGTSAESSENTEPSAPQMTDDAMVNEALTLKHTLRFNENGKFKILVFSDVHAESTLAPDTKKAIEALVKKESPDLVLFNGDLNMCPTDAAAVKKNITDMTEYLEANHIPWAHVYGNHDSQQTSSVPAVSREEQQAMYESFDWCLSKSGDSSVSGVGNYVLPILRSDNDTIAFNVWGLDSGSYLDLIRDGLSEEACGSLKNLTYCGDGYAYIRFNQVAWYYNTSAMLEKYNGAKIPAMMYFHIPLCEYYTVAKNQKQTGMEGVKQENICSSELDSGLFTAALDRGDVKLFVAGHDHVNDFVGEYCGIKLSYDANIGFQIYHDLQVMGARVVEIDQNDAENFTTRMSYLKDIPDWNERDDVDHKTTETIGTAPFAGDVLTAENLPEFKKSTTNLMRVHDISKLTGQYFASGIQAASGNGATVSVAAGKGYQNSSAYGIVKKSSRTNSELTLYLSQTVTLGTNQYLRVWVDFTGIDFRKACFGLVTDKGAIYNTDFNDNSGSYLDFYYLPEGETAWKVLSHGQDDGCFGDAEGSSVSGFRGWLAIPVADFRGWEGVNQEYSSISGKAPTADLQIAGVYFYFDLLADNMLPKTFYFDEIGLVPEYHVFEEVK